MIIVLIFLFLIFPIKLKAKLLISPKDNDFCAKIFLDKLQLFKICLFVYDEKLYYQISKNKPKALEFNFPFKDKPKRKFNFLILDKIESRLYLGLENVMHTVLLNQFVRIISQNFRHINGIDINIRSFPLFNDNTVKIKANICAFTNIFYLFISVFERIFVSGGNKNAQKQSN